MWSMFSHLLEHFQFGQTVCIRHLLSLAWIHLFISESISFTKVRTWTEVGVVEYSEDGSVEAEGLKSGPFHLTVPSCGQFPLKIEDWLQLKVKLFQQFMYKVFYLNPVPSDRHFIKLFKRLVVPRLIYCKQYFF